MPRAAAVRPVALSGSAGVPRTAARALARLAIVAGLAPAWVTACAAGSPALESGPVVASLGTGMAVAVGEAVRAGVASVSATGRPVVGLPAAAPADVGMSAERLAVLDRVVSRGIAGGGYPGAALVVGRRGQTVWQRGYGTLTWGGGRAVSAESTLYDLASLTKVVGTTSAVMALVDDGRLVLDAPVRRYVPAFSGPGKGAVTVRHLLEHRSGLPAGAPLWRSGSPSEARRHAMAAPLRATPGVEVEYSDLGMIVLGAAVEAAAGAPMDVYLAQRVFAPLGMHQTTFRPARRDDGAERVARLAPTGPVAGVSATGRVHDGNAAALDGVAGHAGLFATAADLAVYAQTLLDGGVGPNGVRVFADSTVRAFLRRGSGATRRALGWDTCGTDRDDACGRLLDERAVMHTGFTGTFLVIDPVRQTFAVLLTNRVHAPRAAQPARVIRDVRADVADALALAVTDAPDGPLPMPVAFRADLNAGVWRTPTAAPAATVAARAGKVGPSRRSVRLAAGPARTGDGRRKARV
jgi:CubicO group peptidase (beta-lactamase class C family)